MIDLVRVELYMRENNTTHRYEYLFLLSRMRALSTPPSALPTTAAAYREDSPCHERNGKSGGPSEDTPNAVPYIVPIHFHVPAVQIRVA